MDSLFGEMFKQNSAGANTAPLATTISMEMAMYLDTPEVVSLSDNPLDWWAKNSIRFPHIAQRARYCLTSQATSVPAERVFSTAGDIVSASRSTLTPENANILIFLQKNIRQN
jgi:hypothetical protein